MSAYWLGWDDRQSEELTSEGLTLSIQPQVFMLYVYVNFELLYLKFKIGNINILPGAFYGVDISLH